MEIQQLEILCKQLYEATDSVLRSNAEKTLVQFVSSQDALPKCQMLLDRADSSYAQLLAATTLTKLIQGLNLEQRIDISITNLKFWGHSEQIITKTLMLLSDLSVHFNSVRKLSKLEEVQFMLTHHTSEHFPFLGTNSSLTEMRCRTMFYISLGRLLMFDLGEDEERFYNFLTPFTNQFESLGPVLMDANSFPNEEAKKAIIGLARDLRGLAQPLNARIPFTMLFEWLYYSDYMPILIRSVELWTHDPAVTTPVLKLFAELLHCRTQRLQAHVSSPMGILLFREASKLICIYGNRILHLDVPRDQQYPMRLKGISVCFTILKNALGGNYVNFGVFKLYGDDTLDNVLNIAAKMITSIQQNDLLGSVEHCTVGVQILSQLVLDMNSIVELDANLTFSKNRKIASSFRDQQLYDIFLLSCSLLVTARDNSKTLNFMDESQQAYVNLISHVLRLTKNCLSFDFIGSSTDESSDDMNSVQIPTSWRPAFLDPNTLKLFFDLYQILPNGLASYSLSCLVQMTSVRRSLFSNSERTKFLTHLVEGVKNILVNLHGLSDPDNYHEFCRLLARLKSNYQLGELIAVPCYPEAIALIAKFTVQSLQMWQFAPNSVHYLLTLWQRMVASVPYVKSVDPHLLGTYTPEVTKAYIESRLDAVPVIVRDNIDDPLDDLCMVQQQLEQLSVIERCEYEKTCALLVQHFDQKAREYENLLQNVNSNPMDVSIHELQLTWLVYIIGSAIVGRLTVNSNDDHDTMDAELVIRVFQLMRLTDARLPQAGCEKLELALLSFLEQVRKMHISEQTKANVYKRLNEVFGLSDGISQTFIVILQFIELSLKDNIIRAQPMDKQQTMAQWFEDLMCGIERNVSGKNKEKFTQNLSSFRRDVVNLPKSSSYNTGSFLFAIQSLYFVDVSQLLYIAHSIAA
uniref:Uncharacterized protein n=1 Tax=Glossina austeni TaxID=7395 RepID=A0A1A9UHR9_GLOAU